MLNGITEFFIKKFIIKGIIGKIESLLAKLPQDDAKTVTGLLVALLGVVLHTLPQTSPYAQPILDYLKTLPATEIVAGGILWSIVGGVHKLLKFVVKIAGFETATQKKEAERMLHIVELVKQNGARKG